MAFNDPTSSAELSAYEELGLPPFPPLSDASPPEPVDRNLVRDLLEGRLPSSEFQRVYALIHTYRAWHDAEREVILEQYETWRRLRDALGDDASMA